MFGIPSIYAYLAGGVAVLGVIGGFYALDASRDHYRHLYEADEKVIVERDKTIKDMTTAQNQQTGATEVEVIKVVQGPERIKTIIKTIRDAPEPKDCGTPPLPEGIVL